ncbi:hypothetical protein ACOSQ4_016991 [Xanthoceras sorbifolium]
MDRSWMRLRNRLCKEYVAGVKSFMDTAKGCKDENNCVRCPCRDCQNAFFKPLSVVQAHLYEFGIAVSYDKWIFHGEEYEFVDTGGFNVGGLHMNHENETNIEDEGDDEMYGLMHDMLGSTSNDRVCTETLPEYDANPIVLHRYKTYVKNKARPEGSIAEAYIVNESLTFCSMYLHSIETQFNRIHRNDDGGLRTQSLSIFSQQAQPFGGVHRSELSRSEIECAHWYVLNNCQEVQPFLDKHREMLKREHDTNNVDLMQQQLFPKWFESHMRQLRENGSAEASDELYSLSNGPDFRVCYYPGCVVNGVRYLVTNRDAQRTTQNSGVMVPGEHDNLEISFYGVLISIVELVYLLGHRVILFKCKWFDTNPKKKRIQHDYHLTSINVAHTWYQEDPFILAIQAKQVFYVDDPKLGLNWKVVEEMHHRGLWDIQEKDVVEVQDEHVFYQQNESCDTVLKVQRDNLESQLFHRDDVNADVIQDPSLHEEMMVTTQNMDHYICDENEEDETIEDYCSDETNELQSEDDSDLDHNIS